jgi:primary-amine oxidase
VDRPDAELRCPDLRQAAEDRAIADHQHWRAPSRAGGAPVTHPHPLDPLTADEIRRVTALLRREQGVARPQWRIAAIELREPPRRSCAGHRPGIRSSGWRGRSCGTPGTAWRTSRYLSVSGDTLLAWEPQPGRQPNATVDEWHECDRAMRRHPDVIAALAERASTTRR